MVVFGAAYLLVGTKVLGYAFKNLRKGQLFNEFFLMSLATLGAFYIGEYAEGVAVMLFYVVGEHFQEAAVKRSRRSIREMMDNRPQLVSLVRHGQVVTIDPRLVKPGDVIQVKAGEKVGLDGEMLGHYSTFNTAALTGESRPQARRRGEAVLAGTINLTHPVEIRVTAPFENSTLARILQLVEQAAGRKAKTHLFLSRFAKVYTPVVVYLALGIIVAPLFFVTDYVFEDWLYRALVFLVISCPCALMVSIPLGYFGGIGAASRNGILFKGANYLDVITKVDTVVLDKTGTLTAGEFRVQEVMAHGISREKLLTLAIALERKSNHPVAQAIASLPSGEALPSVTGVEEIPGHGIRGVVGGQLVVAGNARFFRREGIAVPAFAGDFSQTVVLVGIDGVYAGHLTVGDRLREEAADTVKSLKAAGISQILVLSGDRDVAVQEVARQVGITAAFGDLLPEGKVEHLRRLQASGRTVAFAGDGINDAPVLSLADVGVAMGGLGADVAIESADVVIQTDQLSKITTAIRIGRKTRQIVWQNIGFAFGVKLLVLVLGSFGVASLWEAVFADVGVAFLAILNAIRIQYSRF
jgi:Cd2+/Zn2+-exporting ATPase